MASLKLTCEQEKILVLYLIHCMSWLCPVDCGKRKPTGYWLHWFYYEFKKTFENSFMSNGERRRFREHIYEKYEGESPADFKYYFEKIIPPFLDILYEPKSTEKNWTRIFF